MEEADNLIRNGDFEQGNTGFSSSFHYRPYPVFGLPVNYYGLAHLACDIRSTYSCEEDHTLGGKEGTFLAVTGSSSSGSPELWSQTISVSPGAEYEFSLWYMLFEPLKENTPIISLSVNNTIVGQIRAGEAAPFTWEKYSLSWNSGASTKAEIKIIYLKQAALGLDDISLAALQSREYYTYDTIVSPKKFYAYDESVKIWIAPYSGNIALTHTASLSQDLAEARASTLTRDGVRLVTQHNGAVIAREELTPDSPSANGMPLSLSVTKGDRIYFRLDSKESNLYDRIDWEQDIAYHSVNYTVPDVNVNDRAGLNRTLVGADGKYVYKFNSASDFLINPAVTYPLPVTGTIKITGDFSIHAPLNDNITLNIYHNGNRIYGPVPYTKGTTVRNVILSKELRVRESDSLWFEVTAETNVAWDMIDWKLSYRYTELDGSSNNSPDTSLLSPSMEFRGLIPKLSAYPKPVFPAYAYVPEKEIYSSGVNVQMPGACDGDTVCLCITGSDRTSVKAKSVVTGGQTYFSLKFILKPGYNYMFDLYLDNLTTSSDSIRYANCSFKGGINEKITIPVGLHAQQDSVVTKFGDLYRNWGQFVYRRDSLDGELIVESRLEDYQEEVMNLFTDHWDNMDTSDAEIFYDQLADLDLVNINYNSFLRMQPDYYNRQWIGGISNCISRSTMSNSPDTKVGIAKSLFPSKGNDEVVKAGYRSSESKGKSTAVTQRAKKNELYVGMTFLKGETSVKADFMDMNGDAYPDFISRSRIQYSRPQGGLSDLEKNHSGIAKIRLIGYGTTFSNVPVTNLTQWHGTDKDGYWKSDVTHDGGFGSNYSFVHETPLYKLLDINGDGLPDRVYGDGTVDFNLGYRFMKSTLANMQSSKVYGYSFSVGNFDDSETNLVTRGIDVKVENRFDLFPEMPKRNVITVKDHNGTVGVAYNDELNMLYFEFIDMNNDGLKDLLYRKGDVLYVALNEGCRFGPLQKIGLPAISHSSSITEKKYFNLLISTRWEKRRKGGARDEYAGDSDYASYRETEVSFIDMNGDGYPDYVTAGEKGEIKVRYHQGGKNNLLKSTKLKIKNGETLTETTIDYTLSPPDERSQKRHWLMTSVTQSGNSGHKFHTQFHYENNYYDRFERENLGYETVQTITPDDRGEVYKVLTEKYYNTEILRKGLKYYELLSSDRTGEQKYIEKNYHYGLKDFATGEDIRFSGPFCYGKGYPALGEEMITYYEGGNGQTITTIKEYQYGPYGNVVKYVNYGDVNDVNDDLITDIDYFDDPNGHYLTGIPVNLRVTNEQQELLQEKKTTVCPEKGHVLSVRERNGEEYVEMIFGYDTYGNVTLQQLPPNHRGDYLLYRYTYDPQLHTYPVKVTDGIFCNTVSEYDYRWGKLLNVTDANQNTIEYHYDSRGRVVKIKGPYESDYTLQFYYSMGDRRWRWNSGGGFLKAVTLHYDPSDPFNPMTTISFSDAFLRNQVKKDIEFNGEEELWVSGREEYDHQGRVMLRYYPTEEMPGNGNYMFNEFQDHIPPTIYEYDILDRQTSVTLPDGNTTTTHYSLERDDQGIIRFSQTTTDALSNMVISYQDARGLQTAIRYVDNTMTRFRYNALGALTESIDPEGLTSRYRYDMLGRCIEKEHPDAGTTVYQYDRAGNLISLATQKHQNLGQRIEYEYYFNHPQIVFYPGDNPMYVYYVYGHVNDSDAAQINTIGRVRKIEDISGFQLFEYGALGELTKNNRTFAVIGNHTHGFQFTTRYEYDTWNRIRKIVYPDGEEVTYRYDRGGNLKSMSGQANYIENIWYNLFGNRTFMRLGNGTETVYDYDVLQRLSHLHTSSPGGALQTIDYVYDPVGNLSEMTNHVFSGRQSMGGNYTKKYWYDDRYRLQYAEGSFDSQQKNYNYLMNFNYTPNGKILQKNLYAESPNYSGEKDYAHHYRYDDGSNRLGDINGEQLFEWDENGNMVSHTDYIQGTEKHLCWDDENRLAAVRVNESQSHYMYDGLGERFLKIEGWLHKMNSNGYWYTQMVFDNTTLYVSPYLVIGNKGYTKHYYAGDERIVSRAGTGGFPEVARYNEGEEQISFQTNKMLEEFECLGRYDSYELPMGSLDFLNVPVWAEDPERSFDCFYYHKDHLGSSSWVTDVRGAPVQYLDYLPYGEDWVSQQVSAWSSRYTFSGKERDKGTGYSYFGARYYDPELSLWLSVDPMAGEYPSSSPYVYCANNPVKFVDPNGMWYDWFLINQDGYISQYSKPGPHVLIAANSINDVIDNGDGTFQNPYYILKGLIGVGSRHYMISDGNTNTPASGILMELFGDDTKDHLSILDFLARYTDVEWSSLVHAVPNANMAGVTLATSHERSSNPVGSQIASELAIAKMLYSNTHNHFNSPQASSFIDSKGRPAGDFPHMFDCMKKYPTASFRILYNGILYNYFGMPIKKVR